MTVNPTHTTPDADAFGPYHIQLDVFEGPLDLLLHLIKENDVDIFDIPIATITEQYVKTIETLHALNLNIAGEFLLMAATLAHIKSKMLLPIEPHEEDPLDEGTDPRQELVTRLLIYQKYKESASALDQLTRLGRDVFIREAKAKKLRPDDRIELADVNIFKLVESFHRILGKLFIDNAHDVEEENFSVAQSAAFMQERLSNLSSDRLRFTALFKDHKNLKYGQVVACFLAMLSMMKRGVLKVIQTDDFQDIFLMPTDAFFKGAWTYDGNEFDEERETQI